MYDRRKHAPWWQEAFVLSRAVFGVLFWPLAAIFGLMIAIGGLIVAFSASGVWGLLVLAAIRAAGAALPWWGRRPAPATSNVRRSQAPSGKGAVGIARSSRSATVAAPPPRT